MRTRSAEGVIFGLGLPKKSGEAVLTGAEVGSQASQDPVVISSSSRLNRDIVRGYELGANCNVSKPGTLTEFVSTVQLIGSFFACCEASSKGERWNDQKRIFWRSKTIKGMRTWCGCV
jgi:DNA-binding response OmpR family regulator